MNFLSMVGLAHANERLMYSAGACRLDEGESQMIEVVVVHYCSTTPYNVLSTCSCLLHCTCTVHDLTVQCSSSGHILKSII